MTHLSESEFVDFAEGGLPGSRSTHLDCCAACRRQAADVRAALDAATAVTVPEPSPLFWDHLSARVRQGIAEQPDVRQPWWRPRVVAVLGCAAVAVVVVAIASRELPRRVPPMPPSNPSPVTATVIPPGANEPSGEPASTDAAWALLRAAASDMELDDASAAGLTVRPGAVDKAVLDLTPAERDALGRLLQDALKTSARKTL
jgi:hypothetical protein